MIESWKTKYGKEVFNHGVAFKNKDVGIFYHDKAEQDYFINGIEAEYTIERNEDEPKKSKIKPITEEKKKVDITNISDNFWLVQKMEAIKYTVPYAKDEVVARIKAGNYKDGDFNKFADEILAWWYSEIEKLKSL